MHPFRIWILHCATELERECEREYGLQDSLFDNGFYTCSDQSGSSHQNNYDILCCMNYNNELTLLKTGTMI